jgi:hypothetical protein
MKKPLLNAALTLCTVGGAIFGIGVSENAMSQVARLPARAFHLLTLIGGILIILGLVSLLLSFLYHPVQDVVSRIVYGDVNSRYTCVSAGLHDLVGLHEFYTKYFGSDVPSVELMTSWSMRSKSAFMVVRRITQESGLAMEQTLVGSFKVLPLTVDAVRTLDAGQVTGSTFKSEHVATNQRETAAFYVGDVAATGQVARGMVLAHLNAACAPAIKRGLPIYARPLTRDGLRVMTKHGFVQVSDGASAPEIGRICKLVLGKLKHTSGRSVRRIERGKQVKATQVIHDDTTQEQE